MTVPAPAPAPLTYADAVIVAAAPTLDPAFIQHHYGAPLPGAFPLGAIYQTEMTTALTAAISLCYETSSDRQPLQASSGLLAGLLILTTSAPDTYRLRVIAAPAILDPDDVQARHPTSLVGVIDHAAFTRSTTPTSTDFVDDLSFTTVDFNAYPTKSSSFHHLRRTHLALEAHTKASAGLPFSKTTRDKLFSSRLLTQVHRDNSNFAITTTGSTSLNKVMNLPAFIPIPFSSNIPATTSIPLGATVTTPDPASAWLFEHPFVKLWINACFHYPKLFAATFSHPSLLDDSTNLHQYHSARASLLLVAADASDYALNHLVAGRRLRSDTSLLFDPTALPLPATDPVGADLPDFSNPRLEPTHNSTQTTEETSRKSKQTLKHHKNQTNQHKHKQHNNITQRTHRHPPKEHTKNRQHTRNQHR